MQIYGKELKVKNQTVSSASVSVLELDLKVYPEAARSSKIRIRIFILK